MNGMGPMYTDTNSPARVHTDGSICKCEPRCNCHPPIRNDSAEDIKNRGSFHLNSCPCFQWK